jgi:5'-nucleotidase / UDP-sugar diphosphatase
MNRIRLSLGVILIFVLSAGVFYYKSSENIELVILHTNDHHGYCWSKKNKGGFAKQLTLVKKVRAEHKNVLLLSGGDINSGAPESDFHHAEPSFKGMNLLGFNAMAVGNHEFDKPISVLKKQQLWSRFPWLAANIYMPGNETRLFKPYTIQKVGGLRIAVVGLTTEETPHIILENKDIIFRSPIDELRGLMPELKQQADLVFVVSHLGVFEINKNSWAMTSDYEIAESFPNISVIVGGHSHSEIKEPLQRGETLIVQAGSNALNMGELQLQINRKTKKVTHHDYKLHELDETIAEDPQMTAFLDPYYKEAQKLFGVVVGKSKFILDGERNHVRSGETNLGNLITDVLRAVASADVAFQNAGGIRATIPNGNVTFKDIQTSFPFGNTIVFMELTGKELKDVLERSASVNRPDGAFLHVSGVSYEVKDQKLHRVFVKGLPLNLKQTYKVATNNFIAKGGNGYTMLEDKPFTNTGYLLSNALKDYFLKQPLVTAKVEGRIKILK